MSVDATENTLNTYFFLKDKALRITIPATTILCFLCLALIDNFCAQTMNFYSWRFHRVQCYLEIIPVMVFTMLSGYTMGAVSVLAFFTFSTIVGHNFAYHAVMLLAASLLSNLPVIKGWYKSVWKTLLACLIFTVCLGPFWYAALSVVDNFHFKGQENTMHLFIAFPSCAIVCFLGYAYYNFVPQKIRRCFFGSCYDSRDIRIFEQILSKKKRNSVSKKIFFMIVSQAVVLVIAAFGFANGLLEKTVHYISSWNAIVFATRLTFLMAVVSIPVILLSISTADVIVSHPVSLLTKAVQDQEEAFATGKKGEHYVDIHTLNIRSGDEIEILHKALIKAQDSMDQYVEQMEREKALEKNLAVAEAASRAKSAFLSNMSHEIRTPINAVLGFDEMILRKTKEEETKQYAFDIQSAGKNLLAIINDILDFSKIEAGKMEIIPVEYALSSLVNDLVNMTANRAKEKGLSFNVNVDESLPHILYGDEIRIKQCALNILTNAVKYTNSGSVTMTVTGEVVGDRARLTFHVIDTGIGIKREDIPKLFAAFQRIEEERNRTIEGTGLGMNIVQRLLSLMGSQLVVESEYGKGSDFSFTVEQKVVDKTPVGDFSESYKQTVKECSCYRESFHAPDAEILVVDDTQMNLTVFCDLLKDTQARIDTAKSGEQALELAVQKKYDIIFIDHRMPGMDGIETLEVMQTLDGNLNKDTPCVALTANAVSGAKQMYLDAGFTDYFTKPIDSLKLEKLIMKLLPKEKYQVVRLENSAESLSQEDLDLYGSLEGIDIRQAHMNCGTKETLDQALLQFYEAIPEKSALIEKYAAEKNYKDYTVLVHALKSASRLIGALGLSKDAEYLEACGDRQDEPEIERKTPALLELYRSYRQKLSPLAAKKSADDSGKEEMPEADYGQAIAGLKECVEAFDFDTADQIMEMIGQYKVPQKESERYAKIKALVKAADRDALLKILA